MAALGKYSIKDLESLSRIKSHTIRMWEKRYGLLSPARTDTNIRFYTNDDLKKILNVSFLNQHGIKISKIAEMSDDQISQKVLESNRTPNTESDIIENLLVAMIDLDESRFVQLFNSGVIRFGFEPFILQVLFPYFKRIGVMWQAGVINPAQEHFVSNIVRQKLIAAIDSLPIHTHSTRPKVLLFLPGNELHELSLLFYNYALKARQYPTIYLGQSVPIDSLPRIVEITHPNCIVSVITNPSIELILSDVFEKLSQMKKVNILMSGSSILNYQGKLPKRIVAFRDLSELLIEMEKIQLT